MSVLDNEAEEVIWTMLDELQTADAVEEEQGPDPMSDPSVWGV